MIVVHYKRIAKERNEASYLGGEWTCDGCNTDQDANSNSEHQWIYKCMGCNRDSCAGCITNGTPVAQAQPQGMMPMQGMMVQQPMQGMMVQPMPMQEMPMQGTQPMALPLFDPTTGQPLDLNGDGVPDYMQQGWQMQPMPMFDPTTGQPLQQGMQPMMPDQNKGTYAQTP